jgi:hypothetical protein
MACLDRQICRDRTPGQANARYWPAQLAGFQQMIMELWSLFDHSAMIIAEGDRD